MSEADRVLYAQIAWTVMCLFIQICGLVIIRMVIK